MVSSKYEELCTSFIDNLVPVTPELLSSLEEGRVGCPETGVTPEDAAYVLFTSGTTGVPKGIVIEHKSIMTAQYDFARILRTDDDVRMLQFCAFVFDLSLLEIMHPLIHGGSLFVPSEHDRMNNLKEYVANNGLTWAALTPSVVRLMRPEDFPSLELIVLAGEAVTQDVFDLWFGHVRLVNGYGPTEGSIFSTMHEWTSGRQPPATIGRPVGAHVWLVDPENSHRLAPIGTVGEMLLQGPTIMREYLSEPDKTKEIIFEEHPDWAPKRGVPGWNRFMRMGDLGFYNPDGTIEFSTRKDTQVKIRGLRVELGEIKHHVQESLSGVRQVVIDLHESANAPALVAYFCYNDDQRRSSNAEDLLLTLDDNLRNRVAELKSKLSVLLPHYFVPSFYIPCAYMPVNTSQKLDTKVLKQVTAELSAQELSAYALVNANKQPPETDMELRMQQLWAEILNIPQESIGRDDSFLGIGGDSISAIYLSTAAREQGIEILVKNVFDDPRLFAVAETAVETTTGSNPYANIKPFDLLDDRLRSAATGDTIRDMCHLTEECHARHFSSRRSYGTVSKATGVVCG